MPKATAPTLSPIDRAIHRDRDQGLLTTLSRAAAWPVVPKVDELRLGNRHPSVVDLRSRLAVSGDLDPNAVGNDVYDSYVEEAVRRFPGPSRADRRRHFCVK